MIAHDIALFHTATNLLGENGGGPGLNHGVNLSEDLNVVPWHVKGIV